LIPQDYITEWKKHAPWSQNYQVEQDIIISRALVDVFSHPVAGDVLALRGGTALFKLYLEPLRYSEDIDLVQVVAGANRPSHGRYSRETEALARLAQAQQTRRESDPDLQNGV
jgi:predicted nucleotidyltransferase component of viral defense system